MLCTVQPQKKQPEMSLTEFQIVNALNALVLWCKVVRWNVSVKKDHHNKVVSDSMISFILQYQ